jgi:hypothetical protein
VEDLSGKRGKTYTEVIANTDNGESIFVHPVFNKSGHVTCTIICSNSSGKFQTSTSSQIDIEAGVATWQDWAEGTVAVNTTDVLTGPVTGIRGVSVSGEITIEIVI